MAPILPDESLILVAIMPDPRDLELARLLGWYRIPLRFAPKVVDVDYLLFYQTKAFGANHSSCIEYYAEVEGHELVMRKELFHEEIDHPRANEEYFKIQIGKLKQLPKPIKTDTWYRITFFYTTGELVNCARKMNELIVRDDERKTLWRTIKERGLRSDQYVGHHKLTDEFGLMELDKVFKGLSGLSFKDIDW